MRKNDCCDDAPAAEEPLVVPRTCAPRINASGSITSTRPVSEKENEAKGCPHPADTTLRGSAHEAQSGTRDDYQGRSGGARGRPGVGKPGGAIGLDGELGAAKKPKGWWDGDYRAGVWCCGF